MTQCKYDENSAYTLNTLEHGLDATNEECIGNPENYYARVEKNQTTIASTNDKTSITYGCDAHRARSPESFSSHAPPFHPPRIGRPMSPSCLGKAVRCGTATCLHTAVEQCGPM